MLIMPQVDKIAAWPAVPEAVAWVLPLIETHMLHVPVTQYDIAPAQVRQRLADFYVRQKGIEYTRYRSLTAISRGTTPGPENSLGKLVGARTRQEMAGFALDLLGPAGLVQGPWQTSYLGAPGARLAGGTDEILRNIIAERILRLPPESRLDKDVAFKDIPSGQTK